VDPSRIITCGRCVQILLSATKENKIAFRDSLLEKGDTEGARSIESFITPEEEIIDEPTRKFKPRAIMERKRLMRKVRYSYGKRTFSNNRILD